MRNDARLIGEHSPASPIGGHESLVDRGRPDRGDSATRDRRSRVVNRRAEECDDRTDPVMPADDSTLNTRI